MEARSVEIDLPGGTAGVEVAPRRGLRAPSAVAPDPLFILSLPRSFSSVVCAMLGQHPQMYGLLETGLFNVSTMEEWWLTRRPVGLFRCVAELFFGEQTERSVQRAKAWLRRRSTLSTAHIFELIAARVAPRMVIDKTPAMVFELETLRRTNQMFPEASYLYLQRHPRGFGVSVMKHVLQLAAERNAPPPRWLTHLAPDHAPRAAARWSEEPLRDPQWDWHSLHNNILNFLEEIPPERKMTIRGEDLLSHPDDNLRAITRWLGLRSDDEAIEEMKHPERGPYSFVGPDGARFGTSRYFLRNPALRADRAEPLSLEGPLEWRADGAGFARPIKRLARSFGYT